MTISNRMRKIAPSITLSIDARAKQMKKEGIDLIGFGAGEPDFNTPENIKEAGINAIKNNLTRYTPSSGILELKQAIVDKFKKDNNLDYKISDIIISCGAKHSLFNIFMSILNPGDEVIIFSPYWVSYEEQIKIAEGIPVFVELNENNNFEIDFELLKSKINKKTKAIIINSPSNPTGTVISKETLEKIADIALKNNLIIISDEIYEKLVYDGKRHISIASLSNEVKKKTIVVNGVSKTYAMTGWRIGYLASDDKEIISAIDNLQSHSTSNPTTMAQYAAIEALKTNENVIMEMVKEFDKRRKYIMKKLDEIKSLKYVKPEGAFYIFPNFKNLIGKKIGNKIINGSLDLADVLLNEAKVAVVPGIAFGANYNFRLSYATSIENIDTGLNRIANILNNL